MNSTTPRREALRASPIFRLLRIAVLPSILAACGGSGGSGGPVGPGPGPGGPPGPLPGGPIAASHSGLIAAAAGSGEARVEWDLPGTGFEAALFHSASIATLFSGTPLTGLSGTGQSVQGLTNGQVELFALAIRATGTTAWTQAGEVLRVMPRAPIYVDAAATGTGAGTLASPYRSLATAATAAATAGGGNIWVRNGTYAGPILVRDNVHVYGGFAAGAFTLANRNAQSGGTIVTAPAGQAAIDAQLPSLTSNRIVLDGLVLQGNNTGFYGIDTQHADIELRSVTINGFVDRGIHMRHLGPAGTTPPNENANAVLANCVSQQNGADGLSVIGAMNVHIDHCAFDANVQEGIELGPLYAINGSTTVFHVTASRCANNGSEGLDASLAAPPGQTTGSAVFDVAVTGSTFDGNSLDGLLIDQEHELLPGWSGNIVVRECSARHNALAGVHIDADAPGRFLVHRVQSTANGTDGIFVSSEIAGGPVEISASSMVGNLGIGLDTSLGNKRLLATGCVFAGNQGGGFVCNTVEGAATNCIAHLQSNAFQNVRQLGTVTSSAAASTLFSNAPSSYDRVNANSNGTLTLAATPGFAAGATVEIADDGSVRHASSITGATVVLDSAPSLRRVPTTLASFASTSVQEDLRLATGSPLAGQGMIEGGSPTPVDPGPFGAPAGGAPGVADAIPADFVWLDQVTPTPPAVLGNTQAVVLRFSHALLGASVTVTSLRVINSAGNVVAAGVSAPNNSNLVTINPPGGGWPAGALRVELHRSITSSSATGSRPLQPLILPLR